MAGVYPFRGVHYGDLAHLAALTAPPYDVISPAQQQALYEASPHNIVRLELARRDGEEDPYERAASTLRGWLADGILARAPRPGFVAYRQTYSLPGQPPRARTAFFAEVRLEEFSSGVILPHEETFAGPKEDRLRLLRACRANLSPIFGLYRDAPEVSRLLAATAVAAPDADFTDSLGVRHQLWPLESAEACQLITDRLADRSILIADGHHRYETALAYRSERRQQDAATGISASAGHPWYDRVLFCLVSMGDPGLVVLPTHRVLRHVNLEILAGWRARLPEARIEPVAADEDGVRAALENGAPGGETRFVLALPEGCSRIALPPHAGAAPVDRLDVTRLHRELLPALAGTSDPHQLDIQYTQELALALDAVRSAHAPAAILVNPTPVESVDRVAASGSRMPEKSTYFYPKLSTGLVLRVE